MSENGKGDKPRPLSIDRDTFEKNWERAFGRKITKSHSKEQEDAPSDS